MVPATELHSEVHRSGHRLADLAVALSALFVSLCSLGIAVHHGHTMQRLVEANSRPFIQITTSDGERGAGEASTRVLTVLVSNPGAGAARIERFSILVDGNRTRGVMDALTRLAAVRPEGAGPATPTAGSQANTSGSNPAANTAANPASSVLGSMSIAEIAPSYLKAGSEAVLLRWPRTQFNAAVWDRALAAGRTRARFEACYCSIFDECWIESSKRFRPSPVPRCESSAPAE